jgi:hypothetical protein
MTEEKATAIETRPMGGPIATVDVRDASAEGVKLMRERVDNQKKMLAIAIGLTSGSQWTIFGDSVYPTGGAADTILRRAFGLTWGEKVVEVSRNEDGDLEAVCTAWLMQGDRRIEQFEGRRKLGGFIKTEADMRKGAVENMKSVAVRDLLGLRFRSPDELREMGLDIGKVQRRVDFNSRESSGPGVATVPFGNKKGTPVTELDDRSLAWYIAAAEKAIADPEKAKFKAKEEKWLAALVAEKNARLGVGGESEPGSEG